jgi:hypothetical protein
LKMLIPAAMWSGAWVTQQARNPGTSLKMWIAPSLKVCEHFCHTGLCLALTNGYDIRADRVGNRAGDR